MSVNSDFLPSILRSCTILHIIHSVQYSTAKSINISFIINNNSDNNKGFFHLSLLRGWFLVNYILLLLLLLHLLLQFLTMSSRRSRSRQSGPSNISDDQIADLISKLQQLVPEIRGRRSQKVSASKVLQETCNYIRSLHREVDGLSDRLYELLESTDSNSDEAAIVRSLLM